jgi:hypothetical protein
MDASRLLEVLDEVEEDIEGGLTRNLSAVVQQYTTARDTPTSDNTVAIRGAFDSLVDYIDKGKFSNYPPSKVAILKAIGGDTKIGPGLKNRLQTLLSAPGQTAASTVTALTQLQAEVNTFKKSCSQVRAGSKALGIASHTISQGQFEVGVLMPEMLVDAELSSLIKELDVWNKIIRSYQEIAGEEREVTLAGLASGSYETYLQVGLVAAAYLSMTIDKVFEWYQKILEVRRLRQALKDLGAPAAETSAVKKHEREIVDNGIQALVGEIMKQAHPKVDANRKHELETHLTVSIKQITRFVDRGGDVEVVSAPQEAPEEPEEIREDSSTEDEKQEYARLLANHKKLRTEFEKLAAIKRAGSALRQLPPRSEPILQLEMELDEDATKTERQPKKKAEKVSS